ncbi:MAG TPA: hypothetical protein VM290_10295 [Gaiellaceae bacterium]|nr:hypothetical protein [Gaiellaceae bacterium]
MRTLVLAAALALLVAGCGGDQAPPAAEPAPGTVPTTDDPLAGETLAGEPLSLADVRGRTVFVNVWSSW